MSNLPSVTYSSLEKAGMPPALKSSMRQWIDRTIAAGGDTPESVRAIAKLHVVAAAEGVRSIGEAGVFGSILGAAHAILPTGLDVKIPGLNGIAVPLDGVGAAAGLLASIFAAQEPYGLGRTLAQQGASCMTILAFRKTNDLIIAMKQRQSGVTPGGGAAAVPGRISKFNGEGVFGKLQSAFGGESRMSSGWANSAADPLAQAAARL